MILCKFLEFPILSLKGSEQEHRILLFAFVLYYTSVLVLYCIPIHNPVLIYSYFKVPMEVLWLLKNLLICTHLLSQCLKVCICARNVDYLCRFAFFSFFQIVTKLIWKILFLSYSSTVWSITALISFSIVLIFSHCKMLLECQNGITIWFPILFFAVLFLTFWFVLFSFLCFLFIFYFLFHFFSFSFFSSSFLSFSLLFIYFFIYLFIYFCHYYFCWLL